MKKLTRDTLSEMKDELGFAVRRGKGETLTEEDYCEALKAASGNRVIAALLLDISEGTLRAHINRNSGLAEWLMKNYPIPEMTLSPEPIDPVKVQAELDAGNSSIALIARKLFHGRTSVKKFFTRNPEFHAQLKALNSEV